MKVSGYGSINSTSGTNKRKGVSGAGNFADLLATGETTEASQTAQTSDVGATSSLTNLLALQEIPEEEVRRKKLVQRGNSLLDGLEQVRRQLLVGTLSPSMLLNLGHDLAAQKAEVSDPAINAIIEDIELRVAVELAKVQRALENRE